MVPKYLLICNRMLGWLKKSRWKSYDPYDAGLSKFARVLPDRGWWILQHIIRLNPVNFRPLLGIRKQVNAKGLAHSMQACLKLFRVTNELHLLSTANELGDWLLQLGERKEGRCSWNYPFPYITRNLTCKKGTNIVNTSFVALALLDSYEQLGKNKHLDTALGAARFILHDIGYRDYKDGRICFYYAPKSPDTLSIHNANMVAASLIYRIGKICGNSEYIQLAEAAAKYTLSYQLPNGLWHYSERPGLRWIDCFHAGFVLDALMLIANSQNRETYYSAINRGMKGLKAFSDERGSVRHFLHKRYPEDIRSYAQFIQTGVLFSKYNTEWLEFATTVANYAMKTMFSEQGFCYYRRYRGFVIKTPFIRWSIGPMAFALATLIEKLEVYND